MQSPRNISDATQTPEPGAMGRAIGVFKKSGGIQSATLFTLLVLFPALALAQSGTPFDTGFTNLQTLFTGTIAKVASLIAIVIGGNQLARGEPGAKNSRFAYVEVSRASFEASIFTDYATRL